jgi:hypothetical protein
MIRLVALVLVLVFSLPGASCALTLSIREAGTLTPMADRPHAGAELSFHGAPWNTGNVEDLILGREDGTEPRRYAATFQYSSNRGQFRRVDYMPGDPQFALSLCQDSSRAAQPATLLLIGSGLLGLAYLPRRFER